MVINLKKVFLFLLIFMSIHFWAYIRIPVILFRLMDIGIILYALYCYFFIPNRSELRFNLPIIIYIAGTILNMLSALFNHGQMLRDSAIQFFPFYMILIYYILHYQKFDKKDLESLILAFAVFYVVIYLFQESRFPERFFHGAMYRDRGTIRLRITGGGFIMLSYFMSLNRYLLVRKPIYLIICAIMLYLTLKTGFRSLTLISVVLSVILYFKLVNRSGYNYLLILIVAIAFVGVLNWEPTATIIDGMINATEEQKSDNASGDTDIRILSFRYFSKEYPENFTYYLFGGGLPGAFGDYSTHMTRLMQNGYFWVDLGIIGFYFVIGLVALVGLLFWALKAVFTKLPDRYLYLKFYFAYLILASFFTIEIFRSGIFVVEAMVLYLIDNVRIELANQEEITEAVEIIE